MYSKLLIVGIIATAAAGCSSTATNVNSNQNSNTAVVIDPNNLPPGLSASPIAPTGESTPGIPPANQVNVMTKGTTPTPGIPDPKTLGKPMKPGVTPTPGIPDPETLRRQMQQPASNINTPSPANSDLMMRSRKRPLTQKTPQ